MIVNHVIRHLNVERKTKIPIIQIIILESHEI